MIAKILCIAGTLIILDALYSYLLYHNTQSWRGDRQNFKKDNWVRLARGIVGVVVLSIGLWG
jgi:hypothetical protein